MKKLVYILAIICLSNCKTDIKNRNAKIEIEKGTVIEKEPVKKSTKVLDVKEKEINTKKSDEDNNQETDRIIKSLIGFYVGDFEKVTKNGEKSIYVDEAFYWNRTNKINISIDKIKDSIVFGHSVVAGNDRPFKGTITKISKKKYKVIAKEPGDNKYDGVFKFECSYGGILEGTWEAYKNIDIKKRKYSLRQTYFEYDPNIMLERNGRYIDWTKSVSGKAFDEEMEEEWVIKHYSSATDLIYEVNASNRLLKKEEVENMKKGDLLIIRNTIYARHGYSFKNRPLRIFFDAQDWYIPVYADIRNEFTDIEKKNIRLLLKYEKNAQEYYDYFGRG